MTDLFGSLGYLFGQLKLFFSQASDVSPTPPPAAAPAPAPATFGQQSSQKIPIRLGLDAQN